MPRVLSEEITPTANLTYIKHAVILVPQLIILKEGLFYECKHGIGERVIKPHTARDM